MSHIEDQTEKQEIVKMGCWTLIIEKREALGLTQNELAEKCRVLQPTISRWEKLEREPNRAFLHTLSAVLDIPISVLNADLDRYFGRQKNT